MDPQLIVIQIFAFAIFIFSAVLHEVAHGFVALRLGDHTARLSGRLTLNPLKHIDLFGTIILPLSLLLFSLASNSAPIIVGWLKPVPYNPYNFKDVRQGSMLVGLAGPLMNLAIAVVAASALRFMFAAGMMGIWGGLLAMIFFLSVLINIVLMLFNLIPVPPLDGSKLLPLLFGNRAYVLERVIRGMGPIGLILVLVLIFPLWNNFIAPFAFTLTEWLIGGSALL